MKQIVTIVGCITFYVFSWAQCPSTEDNASLWRISDNNTAIVFDATCDSFQQHSDNIEMAGQKVAAILYYSIDENKELSIERDIIFPQLRTWIATNEPEWKTYRAYLRHSYSDDMLPRLTYQEEILMPGKVDSVKINGKLTFFHHPVNGIRIIRTLFPSTTERLFVEKWQLSNVGSASAEMTVGNTIFKQEERGIKGTYHRKVFSDAGEKITLEPGKTYQFGVYFAASMNRDVPNNFNLSIEEEKRNKFLAHCKKNLILETPDSVINTLFYFSKIRASENIFDSKMGLVHSPGGSNYYVGIWANDQIEYSGPFFPFLGYPEGNQAAYNAYKWFLDNIRRVPAHHPVSGR